MKSIVLVLPLALAAACHAGASPTPSPLRVSYGDFRFTEHPAGMPTPFEGTVSVVGDEIEVDTKDIGCFTIVTGDPKLQAFRCGDYSIRAMKVAEGWEFSYGTQREVEQRYTVCDAYKTLQNGAQVCASSHQETRYQKVPVNGRIHLVPETMAGITP